VPNFFSLKSSKKFGIKLSSYLDDCSISISFLFFSDLNVKEALLSLSLTVFLLLLVVVLAMLMLVVVLVVVVVLMTGFGKQEKAIFYVK